MPRKDFVIIQKYPVIANLVEMRGVEPRTSAMRMPRSSQLSYIPECFHFILTQKAALRGKRLFSEADFAQPTRGPGNELVFIFSLFRVSFYVHIHKKYVDGPGTRS